MNMMFVNEKARTFTP